MNKAKSILNALLATIIVTCVVYGQSIHAQTCAQLGLKCNTKKTPTLGAPAAQDQYVLDVSLGRITETQFKNLHQLYNTPVTKKYDPQHDYNLAEFFPTFMQELNQVSLTAHAVPLPEEMKVALKKSGISVQKNVAYVDANCHSVTWQWVNHLQGSSSSQALLSLADGDYLESLLQTSPRKEVDNLQVGDVAFIKGSGGFGQMDVVLHSFVYIGFGLVFEKGNPGAAYPYRVAYLNDVIEKYKAEVSNSEFLFYSLNAESKKIPVMKDVLSLEGSGNNKELTKRLSKSIKQKYVLQETFDMQAEKSIFTMGLLATKSDISEKKITSVVKPKPMAQFNCSKLF